MATRDEARLLAKVALLYYESKLNQNEIAERIGISQSKVSRLLRQAVDHDIVRISVRVPAGVHTDLEEAIESKFGVVEAVVVDTTATDDSQLHRDLGLAAAFHLETTIRPGDVVGISSWSDALRATVSSLRPLPTGDRIRVVQILGGVGDPTAEIHATELTRRLAEMLRGEPNLLPVPGVVGSAAARRVLEKDAHVQRVLQLFASVNVALVGIGALEPSPMLARSGNVFSEEELGIVRAAGGVGDICLRFFDKAGKPVTTALDERVIGMTLAAIKRVPRSIAVAGGRRKLDAITSALNGSLVSHIVTDVTTARALVS
ncbi:MAG: sugar-binding transcriptional regulator [Microbacterium sp.]